MRNTIIQCGGEVHFETRMDALLIEKDEVKGIETNTGKTFLGPVILATGHSARDVYRWLAANNVEIEAKGIAVGVRLEHPATLIDQIQYHNRNGRGKYLPAAEYSFVNQVDGRGVYSFCMCPGGFVVPAASGPEQIVVNGMSPSNRGSRWSNSGMVVELRPEDLEQFTIDNLQFTIAMQHDSAANCQLSTANSPLSMMHFQEYLEYLCWQQGNMKQTAPAQRMVDFTKKKLSYDLPETSYAPGLVSSTSPLLDALFHCRTPEQRFPAIREIQPGVIDERGDNDWSGNPHIGTGTHNKRQGNTATCTYKRIVPLRRRRRICRRHRFCRD